MLSDKERNDIVESWRRRGEAILGEAQAATARGLLTPEAVDNICHGHRNWQQSVQQEGYHAAESGATRDSNPYGPSIPGHNHWIYGFMLGWSSRRRA